MSYTVPSAPSFINSNDVSNRNFLRVTPTVGNTLDGPALRASSEKYTEPSQGSIHRTQTSQQGAAGPPAASYLNLPDGPLSSQLYKRGNIVQINLGKNEIDASRAVHDFDQIIRASIISARQQNPNHQVSDMNYYRATTNCPDATRLQQAALQSGLQSTVPNRFDRQAQQQRHSQERVLVSSIDSDIGVPVAGCQPSRAHTLPHTMLTPASTGTALEGASYVPSASRGMSMRTMQ